MAVLERDAERPDVRSHAKRGNETEASFFVSFVSLCVNYLLFFHRLADRDLWSSHEARAGMDAQTVLDDGAWGLPHLFSGEPELQKPPLYYWLVAAIAWLRGGTVDAWAVRLPAAGSAVLAVLLPGRVRPGARPRPGRR